MAHAIRKSSFWWRSVFLTVDILCNEIANVRCDLDKFI